MPVFKVGLIIPGQRFKEIQQIAYFLSFRGGTQEGNWHEAEAIWEEHYKPPTISVFMVKELEEKRLTDSSLEGD